MKSLIIAIMTFVFISLMVFYLIYKSENIKVYNIFIYISLLVFWISMQIFKTNAKVFSNEWIMPIIISIFQFTQVIVRIPFGILSAKVKSRKLIIQISSIFFIFTTIISICTNFILWSVILTMVGAGVVGATFGLDSQYWSENWNIKKVFKSATIMFTLPILSSSIAILINRFVGSYYHADIKNIMKWILLSSIIFEIIIMGIYSFVKEHKQTIGLDLGVPAPTQQTFKGMDKIWALSIMIGLSTFIMSILVNGTIASEFGIIDTEKSENLQTIILLISLLAIITTGTYFVRRFRIEIIKLFTFTFLIIGSLVGFILAVTNTKSFSLWIITIMFVTLGGTSLQILLFGSTLHLDHKHPTLVLGIFLTVKSFAHGTSDIFVGELIQHSSSFTPLTLTVIFSITLAVSLLSWIYIIAKLSIMKEFYKAIQEYEFN